ncbi:MAG: AAA family ATPase [Gallionella sp.]
MRLTSVQINHYKSLSEVTLDNLPPLTLLVGANGTGKSNLVDALRFLRDMVVDGLDHAMSRRGGILTIRQYSPKKPYDVTIRIEFGDMTSFGAWVGFYEITIGSLKAGNYQIKSESAEWHEEDYSFDDDDNIVGIRWIGKSLHRKADGLAVFDINIEDDTEEPRTNKLPRDQSALSDSFMRWHGESLFNLLSQCRFSSIFPNTLREPSRPDTDHILKESGVNWASVVKSLKKNEEGRRALGHILEMMQMVMPTLQDISVRTVGSYLVPQFHVKDGETVHAFDPVQLSDGTLRVFGILLALYQTPPPPFIALEEPEQTIHPAVLAMLAEAFREVSERTQLLITSHSPYLVDHFQPEEIRIVTMHDGKTRVSPIKTSQMESVKENLISLQELMMAEGLLAEGQ